MSSPLSAEAEIAKSNKLSADVGQGQPESVGETDSQVDVGPTAAELGLPAIQDHPDRELVIFDGHCTFCIGQVRNLEKWDLNNRLAFASLHEPYVKENVHGLSHDDLMKQMYLIDKSGRQLPGAAAIRAMTLRLPRLYVLAPIMHIPFTLPIWQWGYQLVAKRRYKISQKKGNGCDSGSCDLHFK